MRRSLRLKALTIRSVVAALIAALLGGLLQLSPQPITDLMLRMDLAPRGTRPVLLVAMDGDATPGAWIRLAAQLQAAGVAGIALLHDDLPVVTGEHLVQLESPGAAVVEAGFNLDWDHRHRTWMPRIGEKPSLPSRLLETAGYPVPSRPQRIPIADAGVPTLDHAQVAGLNPAAIEGRMVVVGSLDHWATPTIATPGSEPMPLAEAIARQAAGPELPVLNPLTAGLVAGLLALLGTISLLLLRTNAARAGFLGGCATAGLVVCALSLRTGLVLPAEILLAAFFSAGFTWRATTWQNAELQLQRLQDNLLSRLGEGLGLARANADSTWKELASAAVAWGGAEAAWVMERRGQVYKVRARSGRTDHVSSEQLAAAVGMRVHANLTDPMELHALPEASAQGQPPSDLLVVPMRTRSRTRGLLAVRMAAQGGDATRSANELIDRRATARHNLQIFANHAAVQLRRLRNRASFEAVVSEQGVRARLHELAASLEHLLDQRDLLLASHQDSRTAHALYDPLGHPLLLDEGFRHLLEHLRVPPESPLPAVWRALELAPFQLASILGRHEPTRAPLELPGVGMDCWAYTCTYQNRILGVGLELVDISELQAQDTVKSGLLEMISYRVHNILAAIRGYADLLALGAVEASEVAPRIAARCGEMAEIFDRYEDVARSGESGAPEPIQVIDLLQEVVAGARRTVGEHRVRLVNTPVALAPALAHRHDLARALMSLIQELARDTTVDQAVLVELQAPAGAVEIMVRSQGHAPPLHLLQQLATDGREQGSALTNRLVTDMGGSFNVEGGGEAGARYRIQLTEA